MFRLTRLYGRILDDVVPVPAGCLVVERFRRQSRGPARHQTARRHRDHIAAPKSARALDGSGCPAEAPYGCFLPDLTRFGTCRHPNPSNALGARYILPAPVRWGKVANLGQGQKSTFELRWNSSCFCRLSRQTGTIPPQLIGSWVLEAGEVVGSGGGFTGADEVGCGFLGVERLVKGHGPATDRQN